MPRRSHWCLAAVLVLVGCTGKLPAPKIPDTFPVKGKVVLDNKPLTAGTVVLNPAKKAGYRAEGAITKDGTFTVSAFANHEGTVPGTYIVTIRPKVEVKAAATTVKNLPSEKALGPQIPAKYLSPDTSQIKVEVANHDNDLGVIRLVSDKPANKKR